MSQLVGCTEPDTIPSREVSKAPPQPPSGNAIVASEPGRTFSVTAFRLGDQDDSGASHPYEWERFGFDLDEMITHNDFDEHCHPALGGSPGVVFPDGLGGVDNSFGKNLIPIIKLVFSEARDDFDGTVNASIGRVTSGLIMRTTAFSSSADATDIDATAVVAWRADAATGWDVDQDSVAEPDAADIEGSIARAHAAFNGGYLNGDVLVLPPGPDTWLDLQLDVKASVIPVRVHHPLLVVQLDATHTQGRGVLTGVLLDEEAQDGARFAAYKADRSFCEGASIEGVIFDVGQTADIMADEGQDPTQTCDAISFAVGIEIEALDEPISGLVSRPLTDPCAE
ncbi:MAG: hypothetical protein U0271_03550 [Polyangiaceae bacterium]